MRRLVLTATRGARNCNASQVWRQAIALAAFALCANACSAKSTTFVVRDSHSPLRLVRTISLPDVRGRIDHMAIDASTEHLFVAELGNGTVDDVDLAAAKVAGRISGLQEPQGVGWLAATHELAVASADGSVRFFRQRDWAEVARIKLGDDADNVRIDPRNGHLIVGYGSGALAVIDPVTHQVLKRVQLSGHPEAFAINGARVFVNVPSRHSISVADLDSGRVVSSIAVGAHTGNFPMALNRSGSAIAVAFRFPASVSVIDLSTGAVRFSVGSCGDADDLYFAGDRLVIVCGQGVVDLVGTGAGHAIERVATASGARTGLLTDDGKTLFVAVPAGRLGAQLWQLTFRPK